MADYTRQTAQLCTLSELKDGSFQKPDEQVVAGVITQQGLVSRVNIMGVVVEKPGENSIVLDDGTTSLTCRRFDEMEIDADVGDMVLVIGKPREYNDERYLVLEICKRLANKNWAEYRKRELELMMGTTVVDVPKVETPVKKEATKEDTDPVETTIAAIRNLDDGQGADTQEVLNTIENGEEIIKTLMEEGEIFEVKPGRLKVLE